MTTKKTTEPTVMAVLLDGKLVKYPIKFDTNEGWVEMQIPVQLENFVTVESGQSLNIKEDEETTEFYWKTVRKEGTVELVYAKDTEH